MLDWPAIAQGNAKAVTPAPRHWGALLVLAALGCAAVSVLPDLVMAYQRRLYQRNFPELAKAWDMDGSYTPFAIDSDVLCYAARAGETFRSGWPGDPHVAENRSARLVSLDFLSFLELGWLSRLTGGVEGGWLASRALGAALWFAFAYWLAFLASGHRRFSLALAVTLTLYNDLLLNLLHGPMGWLKEVPGRVLWLAGNYSYFHGVNRLPRPAITFPPLLAALAMAAAAGRAGGGPLLWGGAVLGGLLAYFHSDVWAVYMAGMGLHLAWRWASDRKPPWAWGAAYAVSLLVAAPWLALNVPMDPDIKLRTDPVFGHAPDWNGLWAGGLAAWCWLRHRKDPALSILGAALAGIFVVLELQVVTGVTISPFRYREIGLVFAALAAGGLAGRGSQERPGWGWLAVVVGALAAGRAVSYAAHRFPVQGLPADHERAFAYLNERAEPGSVVAALSPADVMYLPAYTHAKTLINTGFPLTSDVPVPEVVSRLRLALDLYGIPAAAYAEAVERNWEHGAWDSASDLWRGRVNWVARDWQRAPLPYAPRDRVLRLLREAEPHRTARADYVWVGPFEASLGWLPGLSKLGPPVFQSPRVSIYRLRHQP